MAITLSEILDLVGKLDDSSAEDSGRDRFRKYLDKNLETPGQARDYIEECLRNSGPQYARALQDLVNYVGRFLGFDISFGRYQGVSGEIGYDGHWKSPGGFHVVIEVKTTEAFNVKTATLVHYIDQLISEQKIPDRDRSLGLYIIGRPDPEVRQLQNSILAEKRTDQLRLISVDSLLSLAELMTQYDVRHDDILSILRPSGSNIDPIVEMIARIVAQTPSPVETKGPSPESDLFEEDAAYWLTPTASDEDQTGEECIQILVGKHGVYAFGERTPGRAKLKAGDWMCFYASGLGVVAHAKVITAPERKQHKAIKNHGEYPWLFQLSDVKTYVGEPVIIDQDLRSQLDAFQGRDPSKPWAWLVQGTRSISQHDFMVLTGQGIGG